jgi:hypothetical protein
MLPVASKSPLHKLQDTVVDTVKAAITHPVGTAGKAVGQARGTVALGRTVVEHVGKTAAGAVVSRLGRGDADSTTPESETTAAAVTTETTLRAVPDETPAGDDATASDETPAPAKAAKAAKAATKKAPAKKAAKKVTRPPVTDVATKAV